MRVEGVSKKFCRSLKKSLWYGVCDIAGELSPFGRRPRVAGSGLLVAGNGADGETSELVTRHKSHVTPEARDEDLRDGEFYAVRDVSFELRRGECLGLIGHNGAGKTTLLKMLNGLIKPDAGKITMRGRVGALIALGAGFNPILTGRENIYINGSVLGLSKKEIDGKIDEIIDFAEIGEFIDSPVMNYSSGMNVRLGFSVAANLINPDILILDEVLAVGDDQFRLKCLDRVGRLLSSGVAGILVTHQMQNIERICTQCSVMSHGRAVLHTWDIAEAIKLYRGLAEEPTGGTEFVYGPNPVLTIKSARYCGEYDQVRIDCQASVDQLPPIFATYAVYHNGSELLRGTTRDQEGVTEIPRTAVLRLTVPLELRRLGDLRLNTTLWNSKSKQPLVWIKGIPVPSERQMPYRLKFEAAT